MSKKLLSSAIVLAAMTIPAFALADKATAKIETKSNTYAVTTPELTTSRGSDNPGQQTDIGDLSRKNKRDFVKDPTGFSGAGTLGIGTNEYGVGFGGRFGYTLPRRVYVGGIANYHFGNDASAAGTNISNKVWYFGPEAGYDLGVGKLILRPVLGLGLAFRTEERSGEAVAAVNNTMIRGYIAPGASVMYPIGNFFVGADSRYMISRDNGALTFLGAVGAHL